MSVTLAAWELFSPLPLLYFQSQRMQVLFSNSEDCVPLQALNILSHHLTIAVLGI